MFFTPASTSWLGGAVNDNSLNTLTNLRGSKASGSGKPTLVPSRPGEYPRPGGPILFKPEEIIFAPTARCNLRCGHCRVSRIPEELEAAPAIAFMEECRDAGIERVGWSGGEPFLRHDFLVDTARAALRLDMLFGHLMTNGLWWKDATELGSKLDALRDAGFDGTIGLSVDAWHEARDGRVVAFIEAAFRAMGRRDCVEIVSARSPDDREPALRLEAIAGALGGFTTPRARNAGGDDGRSVRPSAGGFPVALANGRRMELEASRTGEDDPESLHMPISRIAYSASPEEGAWDSPVWFEDDWCAGPGNVLYVHPDGRVAVCCGFSNEEPALSLGAIGDGYRTLMERAGKKPQVLACYGPGLATVRKDMERAGHVFPGKTVDTCFFCGWLCKERARGAIV